MTAEELPAYTEAGRKTALLEAGASGTIYSLVMPESEAALEAVFDRDRQGLLGWYREAWTQKQDAMHRDYLDGWRAWSAPVVDFDPGRFTFSYPTAGASEGIFKLMSEYAAGCRAAGHEPSIHLFNGEYEGFPAFAASLQLPVVRHDRSRWQEVATSVPPHAQFWISQPSAIDGDVWPHFERFAASLADAQPTAELIPDLTYVGSVARPFRVIMEAPNIPAFVFSHSKPMGGYYHRIGGVFARRERPSLFGNRWFKNLLSLAWGTEMMRRHDVFELPARYRAVQEEAAQRCGQALGVALQPADVLLLGTASAGPADNDLVRTLWRGSASEARVRVCLTPTMATLIDPAMAPSTAPTLLAQWSPHAA